MVEQVQACFAGIVLVIAIVLLLLWRCCSGCGSTSQPIEAVSSEPSVAVSERSNAPAATVEERMAKVSQDLAKLMMQSLTPDHVKDAKEDQLLFQEIWTAVEASSPSRSRASASPTPQRFSPSVSLSPQRQLRRRTSRLESPPAPTARAAPDVPEPAVVHIHSPVAAAAKSPSITRTSRADSPAPRAAPLVAPLPGPTAIDAESSDESDSFPEEVNELNLPPQELALVALINFATLEELKELKGIGAKSAVSIMSYRSKGGAQFACLDDLTKAGLPKTVKARLLKANT